MLMTDTDGRKRRLAGYKVTHAVNKGRLTREPCEVCGDPDTEAHHEDYDKPLEVKWLCRTHHRERHPNQRKPRRVKMRLLKPKTVANLLGLQPRTITRWCREGQFPTAVKVGKSWRIPDDDIRLKYYITLQKRSDGK